MKISEIKTKLTANESFQVEMMRNPADLAEWVVWVRENDGKSFLLTNEFDVVLTNTDANQCLLLMRTLGIKQANVVL
ncbi:hypothetical protein [Cellvibrio sp. KY-YJ-3]|jgi:hypothetical protein|uniref:hypothetical protein n=1 Tax=Cellvibrio sp. KY-YJ-3 TaxID=454662 RepID=UPI00124652DE|nr:hypothetical protein [Cellvibrio sp. KY-YJ-3]QEY10822.1 hypothetical protein D0B88_00245 [Cellvibrio sp. KY-YJ-3]